MEVTMISCGVEILIAGGVGEMADGPTIVTFFILLFLLYF